MASDLHIGFATGATLRRRDARGGGATAAGVWRRRDVPRRLA